MSLPVTYCSSVCWETLSTTLKTARPQQLTNGIMRIIATDR
ncbi:hypothetical protein [Streptomyces hydrogenans]